MSGMTKRQASADKGYIDGWFDGEDVSLFYTKSFFCEEPAASGPTASARSAPMPR